MKIVLLPLRERREDVPLLIDHFLEQFNVRMGKNIVGVSDDVLRCLEEAVLSERDVIRRVQQIAGLGIRTLICGAVSGFVHRMFQHHGIHVIAGVIGDAQDVLDQYLQGNLRAGAILHNPDIQGSRPFCPKDRACKRRPMRRGWSGKGEEDGER